MKWTQVRSHVSGQSRRSRRGKCAVLAGAVALVLMVLAACSAAPHKSSPTSTSSGSGPSSSKSAIVVVVPDQVTSVVQDAGTIGTTDGNEVALSIQAELVEPTYKPAGSNGILTQDPYSFSGVLASSYDVSSDGLTYTFHLRANAVSAQGNPLTAEDVLWSFERKASSPASGFSHFAPMLTNPAKQIHIVNADTVAFTVARAGYGFSLLSVLAENLGAIYDATYLKRHATPADPYAIKWTTESWSNVNYGFGPYEIQSYTPGQGEVLVANDKYALGAPAIKRIERRVVADAGTRESLLASGDADVAEGLTPDEMAKLSSNKSVLAPTVRTNNLLFVSLGTALKPFSNEAVRQAFAYAVPYQQIIDNVYHGAAKRQGSFLDPSAPNYKATFPIYTYNPAKARQLLGHAGYANGITVTLPVTEAIADAAAAAIQIQSYAKQAGFTINLKQEAEGPLFQSIFAGQVQLSVISGRIYSLSPPIELRNFTTALNFAGWKAPQFLNLVDQGEAAGNVLGSAAGTYWTAADALMVESAPYIVIAATPPVIAVRAGFQGYTQRSDGRLDYSMASIR